MVRSAVFIGCFAFTSVVLGSALAVAQGEQNRQLPPLPVVAPSIPDLAGGLNPKTLRRYIRHHCESCHAPPETGPRPAGAFSISRTPLRDKWLAGANGSHEPVLSPLYWTLALGHVPVGPEPKSVTLQLPRAAEIAALRAWLAGERDRSSNTPVPGTMASSGLVLKPDRKSYVKGQPIHFEVTSETRCELTVLVVDATGRATVLWPNGYRPRVVLEPGASKVLPSAAAPFVLRAGRPGQERVLALCGPQGLRTLGVTHDFIRGRFTDLGDWEAFLSTWINAGRLLPGPEVKKRRRYRVVRRWVRRRRRGRWRRVRVRRRIPIVRRRNSAEAKANTAAPFGMYRAAATYLVVQKP